MINSKHVSLIAGDINANNNQVQSAIELLDGGDTVPFIARYRKEATGGLDDTQLRQLEERLGYLREMDNRRETIIKAIEEQGKLTDVLQQSIMNADTKTRLEDLYLPYKKKRQTKAQKARLAGLDPLLNQLLMWKCWLNNTFTARAMMSLCMSKIQPLHWMVPDKLLWKTWPRMLI